MLWKWGGGGGEPIGGLRDPVYGGEGNPDGLMNPGPTTPGIVEGIVDGGGEATVWRLGVESEIFVACEGGRAVVVKIRGPEEEDGRVELLAAKVEAL